MCLFAFWDSLICERQVSPSKRSTLFLVPSVLFNNNNPARGTRLPHCYASGKLQLFQINHLQVFL